MGLGLLWILYARWWSGMRVIFILQFLCVMSGIYWHLTRRGAHCAPANLNRQYFFQWSRIGQTATGRCLSSSPYRGFAGLRQLLYVSLRRDEGIAPYNFFIVRLTFQKAQSPNIFERHVCAAVHHNDSLFFFNSTLFPSEKRLPAWTHGPPGGVLKH